MTEPKVLRHTPIRDLVVGDRFRSPFASGVDYTIEKIVQIDGAGRSSIRIYVRGDSGENCFRFFDGQHLFRVMGDVAYPSRFERELEVG